MESNQQAPPLAPVAINELVLKRQLVLQQNPFLVQEDLASKEIDIALMDDFFLTYRKDKMTFGTLLSNSAYKTGKKESIIKANFKRWRTEYLEQWKKFKVEIKQQKVLSKNLDYNPFPVYIQLIYLFCFVLGILIFYNYSFFAPIPFLYRNILKLQLLILNDFLLETLTLSLLGYLFFVIVFGSYQNIVLKAYRKKHLVSQRAMRGKEQRVKRHFKRCYRKAYKHYLRLARENYYKPYSTNNLIRDEFKFQTVATKNNIAIQNAAQFKRNNSRFKIKKFLAHFIAILLSGGLLVLIIIRLF